MSRSAGFAILSFVVGALLGAFSISLENNGVIPQIGAVERPQPPDIDGGTFTVER